MRVKLQKSVASGFDFARKEELPTDGSLYNGVRGEVGTPPRGCELLLPGGACEHPGPGTFRWWPSASPNMAAIKAHVFSATKDLVGTGKYHRYL
jgi:hypothetical protein